MKIKLHLLIGVIISILFMLPSAHADFRKAIDFYIVRNGDSLMKEVQESVNKNQTDGLLLFLNAMQIDIVTSTKSNLYEGYKDQRQTTTTLKSILNETQQQDLIANLSKIVSQSNADTQFYFATKVEPAFRPMTYSELLNLHDAFIAKGSFVATAWSGTRLAKAELGEPFTQFTLGLRYLNFNEYNGYGCDDEFKDPMCQMQDKAKGFAFLQRALKTYESKGHDSLDILATAMCEYSKNTSNGDLSKLRQAYTWCMTALNTGGWIAHRHLRDFNLAELGPNLEALKNTLPDWVAVARNEVQNEGAPVFTYFTNDYMDFELDVYPDGLIKVGVGSMSKGFPGDDKDNISFLDIDKDVWLKVKPKKVKEFLAEFKKISTDWQLNNSIAGFCDMPDSSRCIQKKYQVTLRHNTDYRRYYFSGFVWHIAKLNGVNTESETTNKIGQVSALVEKYFPTQKLRCGIGNSPQYNQACVDRDKRWASLPN